MSTTRKSALLTTALLLVALGCSDEPSASGTTGIAGTGGTAAGGGGAGGSGAGGSGAGGSGTNDWSCIGQLPAQEFDTGTVVGNFTVVELQDDAPLADITVRVCSASDIACDNPHALGTTDADGAVSMDVIADEQRYLELEGPGIVPATSWNNGPPKSDPFAEMIRVLSPETFMLVENLVRTTGDPERGHAGVQSNDCNGLMGEGVVFTIDTADDATVIAYFSEQGFPNPNFTETTKDGRAAVANLPAGPAVLTATIAATGQVIGSRSFYSRPATIAYPACVEADPEAR